MSECEVCGRTLKTGRKYCHIHRGMGRESQGINMDKLLSRTEKQRNKYVLGGLFTICMMMVTYSFSKTLPSIPSFIYTFLFVMFLGIILFFYLAYRNHIKARELYESNTGLSY